MRTKRRNFNISEKLDSEIQAFCDLMGMTYTSFLIFASQSFLMNEYKKFEDLKAMVFQNVKKSIGGKDITKAT